MGKFICNFHQYPFSIFSFSSIITLYFSSFSLIHANNDTQLPITPINSDLYHTSGALLEEIESLVHRHPDKLSIETFASANKGYHTDMTVITYCRNRKDNEDKSKFRILLTFGQHGRELITTELAFRILSILSEEEFLPNTERASLNNTLDKLIIKVVPIENLNGRKLVEAGDLCERRNGRGVDLNRNWSVDWGKKEKDYDPYEENPGAAAFSEPETQLMRKLSVSFEPHLWVNVHSGMEALFMPYDHKNTTPDGLPSQRMKLILERLNHLHLEDRCLIGSGGGSVGYLAHGTATDFMYDVARVPMAFTFEIYGDNNASSKDCFRMFNPVDITSFNKVLNDWSGAFFTMFGIGARQANELHTRAAASANFDKWLSIDDYLNGYLMERRSRYGKKMEIQVLFPISAPASAIFRNMQGATGIGYGLKYQARCISDVKADTDHTSFLVGTLSLKEENEVHLMRLNQDSSELICEGLFSHPNQIWDLASSPFDLRIFSTVFSDGDTYGAAIWQIPELYGQLNSPQLERIATLDAHNSKIKCCLYLPISDLDTSKTAQVQSQESPGMLQSLSGGAWDPHDYNAVALTCGSSVLLWDLRTMQKTNSIEQPHVRNVDYDIKTKNMLVTAEDESGIHLWDLRMLKFPVLELPGHAHWTWTAKYNPEYEGLILSGGTDSAVNLWAVSSTSENLVYESSIESPMQSYRLLNTYTDYEDSVYGLAWSSREPWVFASLSYDGRVVVESIKSHLPRK
ncbi:hypothetical protein Leryth_012305 [Lithospermum erythrorhizon]|nr:hypothetical protein Leryth_012305 [Lithospermum erythrorhizon]